MVVSLRIIVPFDFGTFGFAILGKMRLVTIQKGLKVARSWMRLVPANAADNHAVEQGDLLPDLGDFLADLFTLTLVDPVVTHQNVSAMTVSTFNVAFYSLFLL